MNLTKIIEEAYQLFAKYTIGKKLVLCSPHCVSVADEKELVNTPLREISRDLLDKSYYQSARSFSDRERYEMKHFLPRVLELLTNFEYPTHSLEITLDRLDFNQQENWKEEEIIFMEKFSKAYFSNCLHIYPLKFKCGENIATILTMFGNMPMNITILLEIWENNTTQNAMLHFKDLIYFSMKYSGNIPVKFTEIFANEQTTKEVISWLKNKRSKNKIALQLEKIIMDDHTKLDEIEIAEFSHLYELMIH